VSSLYDPDRHEPLAGPTWDEGRARAFVAEVVDDTERAVTAGPLWPVHPSDYQSDDGPATGLYLGAAGVCWALDRLATRGWAAPSVPWRARAAALVEIARTTPETGTRAPSYFLGEAGVLAVADRDPDALFAVIESNIAHPALEPLWAAPGTMLPALFQYRRTGEARWRDLWLRNYRHLVDRWQIVAGPDCHLWTQDLYGERVVLVGAAHGFAGNAYALLCGVDLLPADEAALVVSRARDTLLATAIRRGGLANWMPHVGPARAGRDKILVQWCHGAPGMITSLAGLPAEPDTDRVLEEAGALIWQAGPLAKGAGLCHGTAGNGYALLALHRRTGEAVWLERARGFAMHAIGQVEAARAHHGRGRYTLWSGDLGVALFLTDCASGGAGMPSLDLL
jgi:hypothetical protein